MATVSSPARFVVAVHGTVLGGELRKLLQSFGYCPAVIADVLDFISVNGTATGSPADRDDARALNDLVMRHTAHLEFADDAWPAVWSEWVYEPTEPEPLTFLPEPLTGPDLRYAAVKASKAAKGSVEGRDHLTSVELDMLLPREPFEPDPSDRSEWARISDAEGRTDAALDRMTDEADALALLTKAPTPRTFARNAPTQLTDRDVMRTGAVG